MWIIISVRCAVGAIVGTAIGGGGVGAHDIVVVDLD